MGAITGPPNPSLPTQSVEKPEMSDEEMARPSYLILKFFFKNEPDTSTSSLTEDECEKIILWHVRKKHFSDFFSKRVVQHFDSLKPDYVKQQLDRILTDKKIDLEKMDSHERISEIVFDVFWKLAKEEIQRCLLEVEKLKQGIGAELKVPPQSTIVDTILVNHAGNVEAEACHAITNRCLGDKIDIVEKIFQEKVRIKLDLSLDDIRLKEMFVTKKY